MKPINAPAARCPVCGGKAKDVRFRMGVGIEVEPITLAACDNSACDAYYPTARQDTWPQADNETR